MSVIVLGEAAVIVIVGSVIVIPGFEVRTVGVIVIVGGVAVEEVRELDVGLIVIGVVRSIMDGIEGLVIAVDNLGTGGVSTPVVVGYIAIFILHAVGRGGIVFLRLTSGNRFPFINTD